MLVGEGEEEQPPRARGRLTFQGGFRADSGATPASAGPTEGPDPPTGTGRSNPRERGADADRAAPSPASNEQPPRARGRLVDRPFRFAARRATPASAGPTSRRRGPGTGAGSNPRERGADVMRRMVSSSASEQPPRARGRLPPRPDLPPRLGATPASAGPTVRHRRPGSDGQSNPRERGADPSQSGTTLVRPEQPPRARGRPSGAARPRPAGRATPASAGPTNPYLSHYVAQRSNPRERGADSGGRRTKRERWEQPPRARGRRPSCPSLRAAGGATPASAGPTGR